MRWLVLAGMGLVLAFGVVRAQSAAFPSTFTCTGTSCKLTIKNTSGKDLVGLSVLAPAGVKYLSAKDPQATPTTTAGDNGSLVTHPAGECVVFDSTSFACSYRATNNDPAWKNGESRTVSFKTDKPIPANATLPTCGQSNGANSFCGETTRPGASAPGTTTTQAVGRPDVDLEIKAPDVTVPKGRALFKITAVVTAHNIGTKVAHGTIEIRFKDADGGAVREIAHGAGCTEPAAGYLHCAIALAPHAKKTFAVSVLQKTADWAPGGVGRVGAEYITHDRDDPVANNEEEQDVTVKVRG